MKTKTFLILFLMCLIQISYVVGQTWEKVTSLQDEDLQKISTQGLDTVYVVGKNGLIAQSTNRALTWNKQYIAGGATLNDVTFINHSIGIAVGSIGSILKTTDAGLNWNQVTSGTTNNLNGIAATGLDNIWIIGDNGTVLCSVDGGNVWTKKEILSNLEILSDIGFVDSNIGFIVGKNGVFLKTTNAGSTWSQLTTVEDFTQDKWFHSLSVSYKKVAVRNDYYDGGNLFLSTDYSIWTIYNSPAFGHKSSLYFVTDNIGFMSSFDIPTCCPTVPTVKLYKTSDGGLNWIEVAETGGSTTAEFKFPNESLGYFISGNVILRTPYTGEFQLNNVISLGLNKANIEMQQVENSLFVSSDRNDIVSVTVYDIAGKLITKKNADTPAKRIEINNLLKGVYLIHSKCTENIIDIKKITML